MGIKAPPSVKFELIWQALSQENCLLRVNELCRIAGVSRSGYYNWLRSEDKRRQREAADKADFELILDAYKYRGYAKGARSICMVLLRKSKRMNLKKVRRLMKKYRLVCPIRRVNPYRRQMQALHSGNVADNLVKREFREHGARKILLTDITYLYYRNRRCYLSTILDAYTREVLAYQLSESLEIEFVLDTVSELVAKYGAELDDEVIVHSDQGCHYTSKAFIQALRDGELRQSMSQKGNCWDNAPQESFFGHMKDEIAELLSKQPTFDKVKAVVDDWIDYYNNERYQWDLLKLSPREYYEYVTTGALPSEIAAYLRCYVASEKSISVQG